MCGVAQRIFLSTVEKRGIIGRKIQSGHIGGQTTQMTVYFSSSRDGRDFAAWLSLCAQCGHPTILLLRDVTLLVAKGSNTRCTEVPWRIAAGSDDGEAPPVVEVGCSSRAALCHSSTD